MQPLDRVCFSAVKGYWNEECQNYMQQHPGKVVTRAQFSQVFKLAWARAMTMTNILARFKTTGIQPFNRFAITLPGGHQDTTIGSDDKLPTVSNVAFYPLLY